MSVFRYNGVYLHLAKTAFSVEEERDPSNSDVLWYVYRLKVRGFIAESEGTFPGVSGTPNSPTAQLLQARLAAPRRPFLYSVGGITLLEHDGGPDARLGPATKVEVKAPIAGVYPVDFELECRKASCGDECDVGSPVVSLRWEQTESFGENWEATLTTSGLLIVRADMLFTADTFRPLCVPPVLPDYKRIESSYTMEPDGLRLRFNFVDKEFDRLPPYPATRASGQFTVQVTNGAKRMGQVRVRLEGQKGTSRKHLMLVAVYMAYAKLHKENERGNEPFARLPLMSGHFTEGMTGLIPTVEVELQTLLPPLGGQTTVVHASADGIIAPPMIRSVGIETYGLGTDAPGIPHPVRKRVLGLIGAAFRDPCACQDGVAELTHGAPGFGSEMSTGERPADDATLTVGPTNAEELKTVADEDPYDTYECDIIHDFDEGKVLMPAATIGTEIGIGGSTLAGIGKVVTLHGGRMFMTLVWVAGRTGRPPVLPAYQSPDPNYVPLGFQIVAKNVEMNADNTQPVFMVSGYYVYAVVDPSKANFTAPLLPFFTELVKNASDVALNTSKALMGPGGGNGPIDIIFGPPKQQGEEVVAPDVPGFDNAEPLGLSNLPASTWGLGGFQDLSSGGGSPVNP